MPEDENDDRCPLQISAAAMMYGYRPPQRRRVGGVRRSVRPESDPCQLSNYYKGDNGLEHVTTQGADVNLPQQK